MTADLIGRDRELAALGELAAVAAAGRGTVALIAGEAGAGKTALARAALAGAGLPVLEGAALDAPAVLYGPFATILRRRIREAGGVLAGQPELRALLACALPELGPPPAVRDQGPVFEAIAAALLEAAAAGPVGVLLDDVHWCDETSLDLLGHLAGVVQRAPVLVLAAYRSDEVPRGHPVRRLRSELRRHGRLREVTVLPLAAAETALLLERVAGAPASPALAAAVHDRTEGVPFFVEELAAALAETGRLVPGPNGLEARDVGELPLPESVRDAVMVRAGALPDAVRDALGIAAVAGQEFDLDTVAALHGRPDGAAALPACGLVRDLDGGRCAFRHALIREAVAADLPWTRRRGLHRDLAARLEAAGGAPAAVAAHWLAAGERDRGARALLAAAEASSAAGAHRDAAAQLSRALELWPAAADEPERLRALGLLGSSAELAGDAALAARAWTEAAGAVDGGAEPARLAGIQRRLATALELQGAWERALGARRAAADAFAAAGEPGEAAVERLAAALRLRTAGSFQAALDVLHVAEPEAERAARTDLIARIRALRGNALSRSGAAAAGLPLVRAGLDLALAGGHAGAAAEAYVRLADAMEHGGDLRGASDAYVAAAAFCEANRVSQTGDLCLACLTMVLRQLGEWDRSVEACRAVLASQDAPAHARAAAHGVLGSIEAHRGRASRARPHLHSSSVLAAQIGLVAMELDAACCLARLDDAAGRTGAALERCRAILDRWRRTDVERHYAVPVLRWVATFAARQGRAGLVGECASALARVAAQPGVEGLAGLAHAVGEAALLAGDPATAAVQFELALSTARDLPLEGAETGRRAGAALAALGRRSEAVEHLVAAHRAAKRLGARPLAAAIAEDVAALGERVDARLGRLAAAAAGHAGLSRREVDVARLVAQGRTSREVAAQLHLSVRTVEAHVHSVLVKVDARSRVDIARRAAELGLLP